VILKEKDLRSQSIITEKQIQDAEKDVSIWEAVKPLFKTDGWKVFIEHVKKEHDKLNSLSDCDPNFNRFLYQKGEVAGIKRFLQIPKTLQQRASSASEILEAGQAEDEE